MKAEHPNHETIRKDIPERIDNYDFRRNHSILKMLGEIVLRETLAIILGRTNLAMKQLRVILHPST